MIRDLGALTCPSICLMESDVKITRSLFILVKETENRMEKPRLLHVSLAQ
jgi:hypothetical protein